MSGREPAIRTGRPGRPRKLRPHYFENQPSPIDLYSSKGVPVTIDHVEQVLGREAVPKEPTEQEIKQLESAQERRWKVYRKLPEPRPDYAEWASAYSRRQEFDDTERIARYAPKMSDRLKAKELLLKYGKPLPKQQIEIENVAPQAQPVNPQQVLDLALKLHGIPQDKFNEFLKSIRA